MAYSGFGPVELPDVPVTDVVGLSWFELRRRGVVERFEVTERGQGSAGISLAHIGSDRTGEYFFGEALYERALRAVERRGGADHLMLYSVDGSRLRLFVRQGWSIEQDGDTTLIDPGDVVMLGLPSGGIVFGEATLVGIMLVDGTVDIARPFTFLYDLGEELGVHTVEYTTQDARVIMAEAEAAAEAAIAAAELLQPEATLEPPSAVADPPPQDAAETDPPDAPRPEGVATSQVDREAGDDVPAVAVESATTPVPTGQTADPLRDFDFVLSDDETLLERTFAETSWSRVATMLLVLGLATWAFFAKNRSARWVSLGATFLLLGFIDGGFLSVSHITSGIWAGAGVYLRDLPLLLIIVFTVVTTLIWGRVFCGFLCPFGALQDFIELIVPRRLQRALPQHVHERASYAKYGILALIVLPALAGGQVSLYQYFEPFGTVFFLSSSLLFWTIAGAFLLASARCPAVLLSLRMPARCGARDHVPDLAETDRTGRALRPLQGLRAEVPDGCDPGPRHRLQGVRPL